MMRNPGLMIDLWLKEAQAFRAAGPSDIRKERAGLKQVYSQPNPPTSATQPSTVSAQKELNPPPVL